MTLRDPKALVSSVAAVPLVLVLGGLLMMGCGATAPVINNIGTPDTLEAEESGRFRATIANQKKAKKPLRFTWRFGDGTRASTKQARHAYGSPGTYRVRFVVRNEGGADTSGATVRVVPRPKPPQITSVNASPNPVDEGESVRFRANVKGTAPLTYRWRFGDGATASGRTARHTYKKPGQYSARLLVSNEVGERSRTVSVRVNRTLPSVCRTVNELNSAFFERNSSTLTKEARSSLKENAKVLAKCPNLQVRLEGFAAPRERNAQQLSRDRARAVAKFYRSNQVPGSRITTRARGKVKGATSKKGKGRQYRRVDSVLRRQGN